MAWSWSHSAEGMQNVRDNIAALDRETLQVIYAEWKACDAVSIKAMKETDDAIAELRELENAVNSDGNPTQWSDDEFDRVEELRDLIRNADEPVWDNEAFDSEAYAIALEESRSLPIDTLADYITERAETTATCDNGGFNAWVCPSGCHTVSFSSADELENVED